MRRKIFNSVLFVTGLTAIITILSVMFLFFPFLENEILQEMKKEVDLIRVGMAEPENEYLGRVSDKDRRITLIAADGTVLFDSGLKIKEMDNHADRVEIRLANEKGEGSSLRFSDTLTHRTINYAKKLKDGRILRMSMDQNYVVAMLSWLIPPMGIIITAVFFFSAFLSSKVSDNILKPLYGLDLEHPEENSTYEELRPLTQRIESQNRKLKEKIYEEMSKKTRKRSEFTANMTHELKTPLTSISGFAELMMKDEMDFETVKDFSKSIYDESARLIRLVGDIIKIEEMDERMESYVFEPVDLNVIAKDVCERLKIAAAKKDIKVEVSDKEAVVYGVENILFEMLYNLCDNAIKYNVEEGFIQINTYADQKGAFFSIKDSGIGIPTEEQERIFDRFYRVDKSRSKELGGTGLGLSVVRQGAVIHSAEIRILSKERAGTQIILEFPPIGRDNKP